MADYIYLLENRLSLAQRSALRHIRDIAQARGLTIFLVGGAVRDMTSGSPIRDLDVVVQGNALKLRKDIEKVGGVISGENEAGQALYVRFPGSVRIEVGSTLSMSFPKPGKPVVRAATILEDLRRRDFTANAMALSLNEGSYGLLMDPLNGVADIENRQLRLVSNYGFIEDPVRMIRAARLMARLGWTLDEKTQTRYETGQQEGYIAAMSDFHRGYETEEIVHEEDPLRVLKKLETEGWMKHLAPYWTAAKADVNELRRLREAQSQLEMQGVHPDTAAANFPLLVAKLSAKEIESLKSGFPRKGFVAEIAALEQDAKDFAAQLSGKGSVLPSQAWKLISASKPEAVLWVAFSAKSSVIQAKFKSFYTEWPQARQKMPYLVMQEMRIVPELAGYNDLLEKLFFELMDGKLSTPEEMKAFLEPYSPPAPPPPMSMRRLRTAKKETKAAKSRSKKSAVIEEEDEGSAESTTPAIVEAQGASLKERSTASSKEGKGAVSTVETGKAVAKKVGAKTQVPAPITDKPAAKKASTTKPEVASQGNQEKRKLVATKPAAMAKHAAAPQVKSQAAKGSAAAKKPSKLPVKVSPPSKKMAGKTGSATVTGSKSKLTLKSKQAPVAKKQISKKPLKKVAKPASRAIGKAKSAARKPAAKVPFKSKVVKKTFPVAKSKAKGAAKKAGRRR